MTHLIRLLPALALLGSALAVARVPSSADCPSPGFPARSQAQMVASRSRVDGLPMLILALHSPLTGQQLLTWYDHRWRGINKIPRAILYRAGPWMVVARKTAGCFETVQVPLPLSGPATAYLAISRPNRERKVETRFPMPGGSQVLLTLDNGGREHSQNVLLRSPENRRQTAHFYRKTLSHSGWALQMDQSVPHGEALMFQKGDRHAEISINSAGAGSHVFISTARG